MNLNVKLNNGIHSLMEGITVKKIFIIMIGAAILSFGIHNIHQRVNVTEGGVIGLMLFIEHWMKISPSFITPLLDGVCYLIAFKMLGFNFIKLSVISTAFISLFYKLWESLPFMLPNMIDTPLLAAVIGGLFVGVGVGLIVRQGGSSGGDDALALAISKRCKWNLAHSYMFTDFVVLFISLSYIPFVNVLVSLVTVTISSNVIDWIKDVKVKK